MTSAPFHALPLWTTLFVIGLAAILMGTTLFAGFESLAVIAGFCMAVSSMVVAWLALHWRNESTATRVSVLGNIISGIISLALASALTRWFYGANAVIESVLPAAISTALSGAALGAPPGLVFGALFALPIRRVHRLSRDRAIEAPDRVFKVCSLWLLAISLGCLGIDVLVYPVLESPPIFKQSLILTTGIIALLSLVVAAVAQTRISRRRKWFERVQAGSEPGWTIMPRSDFVDELDDLSPLFVAGANHNVVLVRCESVETGGAYRQASNLVPYALVHLPEGLAAMSFALPNEEDRRSLT